MDTTLMIIAVALLGLGVWFAFFPDNGLPKIPLIKNMSKNTMKYVGWSMLLVALFMLYFVGRDMNFIKFLK